MKAPCVLIKGGSHRREFLLCDYLRIEAFEGPLFAPHREVTSDSALIGNCPPAQATRPTKPPLYAERKRMHMSPPSAKGAHGRGSLPFAAISPSVSAAKMSSANEPSAAPKPASWNLHHAVAGFSAGLAQVPGLPDGNP